MTFTNVYGKLTINDTAVYLFIIILLSIYIFSTFVNYFYYTLYFLKRKKGLGLEQVFKVGSTNVDQAILESLFHYDNTNNRFYNANLSFTLVFSKIYSKLQNQAQKLRFFYLNFDKQHQKTVQNHSYKIGTPPSSPSELTPSKIRI